VTTRSVKGATDHGVDLALDGIGGETSSQTLDAVKHFGRMVVFGAASGEPGQLDTGELLFANQEVVGYHLGRAMNLQPGRVMEAFPDLQEGLMSGELEVILGESFDLRDAAEAHEYIEARKSSGKVVLTT